LHQLYVLSIVIKWGNPYPKAKAQSRATKPNDEIAEGGAQTDSGSHNSFLNLIK